MAMRKRLVHIFFQPWSNVHMTRHSKPTPDAVDPDLTILKHLFSKLNETNGDKVVHHQVETKNELSRAEILETIDNVGDNKYEAYLFIFLSHYIRLQNGVEGIACRDENDCRNCTVITVDDILSSAKNNKTLVGKEKLFIIQADDIDQHMYLPKPKGNGSEENPKLVKIPTDADRLVIWCAIPVQLSQDLQRLDIDLANKDIEAELNGLKPSMLILALYNVFTEPVTRELDLLTQTTYINGKVLANIAALNAEKKDYKPKRALQVPLVTSTLRKLYYVNGWQKIET